MRAILIIIFILLIAILVPPYWFGMKAEDEYNNLIQTVSEFENLEIVSKSYKRGWLSSSSETTYSLKDEDIESLQIIEKDTIYHGPIPVGLLSKGKFMLKPVMAIIETKAQIKTEAKEEYSEFINTLPTIDLQTTLSLNGYGTSEVSIPSVELKLNDEKELKWSGLDGLINFTPELYTVYSVINSGNLEIEDDTFRVKIAGIDIESNLDYPILNYKNPLGDLDVKIAEFSSEGKDGDELNKVTLTNLEFTASTDQKRNLLNHTQGLGFETLTVGENSYGPGIYELQIRNIDKAAFEEIQLAINQSQNQEVSSATDLITAEMMKVLPTLFKNAPEIELTKLSIKTGEGEINGHATISVSGDSIDNPELAANPIFLLAALSAEIKLSVSKPLMDNLLKDYKIEEITDEKKANNEVLPTDKELQVLANIRAQSEIQEMLDQGIFVIKNGSYEIEAVYGLGQIKVNGKTININSFLNL
ncbi:MAG: YdgA family protein [Thermodesulfobacteriota bacterium]